MNRIWHPWTEWECYPAGLFDGKTELPPDEARAAYANFLRDTPRLQAALQRVLNEWPKSCEHFLSNEQSNRIAWLGQAAMCIETGINNTHRSGFKLMTDAEQRTANETAAAALRAWTNRQLRQDVEGPRLP